jgi:CheY-like chemotaxis protein
VREALPDAVVRVVLDGDKAIDAVRRRAPHVLLLDLQMPGMNGIEVMMYLRGTGIADRTSVLAVSANAQPHDMQLLQLLGITKFVRKGSSLVDDLMPLLREARSLHDGARISTPEPGALSRRLRGE